MGSSNSRGCHVLSIETASIKKPLLYVEATGRLDRKYLIEALLHGRPAREDLAHLWDEINPSRKESLTADDCYVLVKEVVYELPFFTRIQLQAGCEAIDQLVDDAAKNKGGFTQKQISDEKSALKAYLVKPMLASFDRIETQRKKDLKKIGEQLFATMQVDDKISKDVFLAHFPGRLVQVLKANDVDIGFPSALFFPYGNPSPSTIITDNSSMSLVNSGSGVLPNSEHSRQSSLGTARNIFAENG